MNRYPRKGLVYLAQVWMHVHTSVEHVLPETSTRVDASWSWLIRENRPTLCDSSDIVKQGRRYLA